MTLHDWFDVVLRFVGAMTILGLVVFGVIVVVAQVQLKRLRDSERERR